MSGHERGPVQSCGQCSPPVPACPVVTAGYCAAHGFVHGHEAEELREGIEKIIAASFADEDAETIRKNLSQLLDRVDARDSLAFCESEDF